MAAVGRLLKSGLTALEQGQLQQAGQICQQILQQAPDLSQGHFLVGLVALEGQDRKTAFQAFRSVIKLDPDHGAAWGQLSRLYLTDGLVNRADEALKKAVATAPEDPMVQDLIGTVCSLMGEHLEAKAWFEKAAQGQPRNINFKLNLANNHVYHGNTAQAVDMFEEVLARQPNAPQAHWSLAGARKAKDDKHITQCAQQLVSQKLHPRAQAFYYYAIGKECEDLERWDDAFEAFARGAHARRATVEYDEAAEQEMFKFLETQFDAAWLEQAGEGNPEPSPIFILGQPRTGTTLVERIVTSHSQVTSAGELQQFSLALRRLSAFEDPKRFSAGMFDAASQLDPQQVGSLYLDTSLRMRGDTPRFVDKLPQNYLCIPLILAALPNAKIVHLTRHPMDACFSSFKQLFADAYLHSYDQREMARHHARYRTLMQVWHTRFPGRVFDISYEDTTVDLERNTRALLDFLELPFEQACVDFHTQSGAVSTASAAQVREPAHTRSVGRWRRYETQLAPMREELIRAGIDVS